MNPAGRDTSVAPDSIATLSRSVVTQRSWWFAGMTDKTAAGSAFRILHLGWPNGHHIWQRLELARLMGRICEPTYKVGYADCRMTTKEINDKDYSEAAPVLSRVAWEIRPLRCSFVSRLRSPLGDSLYLRMISSSDELSSRSFNTSV